MLPKNPTLGQVFVILKQWKGVKSSPFTVQVLEYKFDGIRQEAYWVTKEVRSYRNKNHAEAYAARFCKDFTCIT